jgi:hypothetical protein
VLLARKRIVKERINQHKLAKQKREEQGRACREVG